MTPEWFKRSVAMRPEDRFIDAAGCRIHYLRWGVPGKPGLLLIHGSGAHAHWWDFIAPFFAEDYSVAALDLSGMGDSGHREHYSSELFVQEVMSVCAHAGLGNDPVLAGHSFGGYVALKTAVAFGNQLKGVALIDSPVRPPDYAWEREPQLSPIRPRKIYATRAEALARFRLVPAQPCENTFLLDYIASHSLAETKGGWSWKFDEQLLRNFDIGNPSKDLSKLPCRIAVIYGEQSQLFTREVASYMFEVLDHSVPFVAIPEAHHHLFLDQPLAFVASLRTVLAEWRHSKPNRVAK